VDSSDNDHLIPHLDVKIGIAIPVAQANTRLDKDYYFVNHGEGENVENHHKYCRQNSPAVLGNLNWGTFLDRTR
jgi:hypothetical protein